MTGLDPEIEALADGPDQWLEVIVNTYGVFGGDAMVGLLVGSALMMALYIHSGDMALPTVVLILISGTLFTTLPGDFQQTAMGVMTVGIAAALFEAFRRYVW